MKKWTLLLLLSVFLFSLSGNAFALPVIDGVFGLIEWAGYYAEEDNASGTLNTQVGPGWGGQYYDVEYLGLIVTPTTVFFGLQTGFDVVNGRDWGDNDHFDPGDFALDINSDGTYDYAIKFSINSPPVFQLYTGGEWQSVRYDGDPPPNYAKYSDPFVMDGGGLVGDPFTGALGVVDNQGDTSYVLEGSFDLSLLSGYQWGDPITIHWTMECGNDYLNQTSAPVPEPATMFLFGIGLCGLAIVGRKRIVKGR